MDPPTASDDESERPAAGLSDRRQQARADPPAANDDDSNNGGRAELVSGESSNSNDQPTSNAEPKLDDDQLDRIFHAAYNASDPRQEFQLYQQAANHGHLDSIHNLGWCYRNGFGVDKDPKQAFQHYQQGAKKGHLDSINALGWCYENGFGVDKDPKQAFQLYQQAANQGHLASIHSLGFCFVYGLGIEQNFKKASELFEQSKESRVDSLINLGWLYAREGSDASVQKAIKCFKQSLEIESATDSHKAESLFLLAELLASSTNTKDLYEARNLIQQVSPKESEYHERLQWLRPFIDEQLELLDCQPNNWQLQNLLPDFVFDGDIQLIALIGMGQFGKVYLAQFQHKQFVAVKMMNVDLVKDDAATAQNILRERFTCRVIQEHKIEHCVRYHGFVDVLHKMQRGLVFELCANISDVEGDAKAALEKGFVSARYADIEKLPDWSTRVKSSLRSAVVFTKYRKWSFQRIVGMLRQVAQALDELHKLGIIHRDIAARNVLCDAEGNVQLADFGLSKMVGSGDNFSGIDALSYSHYLTPGHQYAVAWWAPECVARNKEGDHVVFSTNSDVYSFGVLMWQCFAHRDPFDDVRPAADSDVDRMSAARTIVLKIMDGERPSLEQLDKDIPDSLIELMKDCWATDPDARPCLKSIMDRLETIAKETLYNRVAVARSVKKAKWFDVRSMYQSLPMVSLREQVKERGCHKGVSFTEQALQRQLAAVCHPVPPSNDVCKAVLDQFSPRKPYDVFLINTSAQKHLEADTMQRIFNEAGLSTFLDADMGSNDNNPREAMRFALETCRHIVALVSKAALEKRHPREELQYAYSRMVWHRDHPVLCWEPVWVVLYDLSVSEYHGFQKKYPELPNLCGDKVIIEKSKYVWWTYLCDTIKADIIDHDHRGAVDSWKLLLEHWDEHTGSFPSAGHLYS